MAAITISNLRINPYTQKNTIKPVYGDTMTLTFALPEPFIEGDDYILALDYERVLVPTARPLCAMTSEYTVDGGDITFALELRTARFRDWVSTIKKPMPVWLQIQRKRGGVYDTLLLDDVLALPSVADGDNTVFPGDPLLKLLEDKLDKPAEDGDTGDVLKLGANRKPVWGKGGGGGGSQVQSDWDESDSSEPSYIQNKPSMATELEIDEKNNTKDIIVPNNLDYAVRSVLPNVTVIPAATTEYSLVDASATTNSHSWQYFHAPAEASTYTFPAVTDTDVAHRIKLTLDFTTVQTYSFEDAEGTAIVPLFTPTLATGDVYEFDCEYSAVKSQWLVWPHKQGAVSDDYVMQSQVGAANGVAGLNSNSVVPDENLNTAGVAKKGCIMLYTNGGLDMDNGRLVVRPSPYSAIDSRTTGLSSLTNASRAALVPNNLNYAVTAALTDANKIQLTDAQKAYAQDTIGAFGTLHLDAAPTTSTVGAFGQRAIVDSTGKAYTCMAVTNTGTEESPVWSYTWKEDINEAGGTIRGNISMPVNATYFALGDTPTVLGGASYPHRFIVVGTGQNIGNSTTLISVGEGNSSSNAQDILMVGDHVGVGYGFPKGAAGYGKYNLSVGDAYRVVGKGANNARRNIEELSGNGDLFIYGEYQQEEREIPSATSYYAFSALGRFRHSPASAPIYAFPAVQNVVVIGDLGRYFTRKPSDDGDGYYAWESKYYTSGLMYSASPSPAVGSKLYSNTALTSGARSVTAIDNRTHHVTLNVYFRGYARSTDDDGNGYYAWKDGAALLYTDTATPTATETVVYSDTALTTSVGTVALYESNSIALAASASFEDAAGNDIVPRSTPTIKPGTVVQYLCEWEPCTSQWVIMPIPMVDGGAA